MPEYEFTATLLHAYNGGDGKITLASSKPVELESNVTSDTLLLDVNGNGDALNIDHEATSANAINIDAVNTSGQVIDVNFAPASSSNCNILDISSHANHTGKIINLSHTGTGRGISIDKSAVSDAFGWSLLINDTAAQTNVATARMVNNNTSTTTYLLELLTSSSSSALLLDQDSNSASRTFAMKINTDNAGAGGAGGIDMSTMSVDEPLIKAPSDAISSLGTLTHQIAVDIGGTIYYIPAYTTGS